MIDITSLSQEGKEEKRKPFAEELRLTSFLARNCDLSALKRLLFPRGSDHSQDLRVRRLRRYLIGGLYHIPVYLIRILFSSISTPKKKKKKKTKDKVKEILCVELEALLIDTSALTLIPLKTIMTTWRSGKICNVPKKHDFKRQLSQ